MEYKKFEWTNRTHLNAENFNNIENGIYNCTKEINNLITIVKQFDELKDEIAMLKESNEKLEKEIKTLKTKVTKLSKVEKE